MCVLQHQMVRRPAAARADAGVMLERREEFMAQKWRSCAVERVPVRGVDLIEHLLEFSRKGAAPEKEAFDVQDALRFPLALVASKALRNDVKVRRDFHPAPMKILGHKDMFEQVVINLSMNAVDAMPEGGVLTLRSSRGELNARAAARVEVSDTGKGIPQDLQGRIFEPFFTTKPDGKGSGLGLAMVRETALAHDGLVELTSDALGTAVRLLLPLA